MEICQHPSQRKYLEIEDSQSRTEYQLTAIGQSAIERLETEIEQLNEQMPR